MRKSKILWNRFELKIFMLQFIVHDVTCGWRTLQRPPYSWCTVPKYHNHMCTWSDSLPKHTNEKEGCTNKCKGMVFTLYLDLPVSLRPPLLDKGKTQFAAFSPGHFITSPFQTDKTKQTKQTKHLDILYLLHSKPTKQFKLWAVRSESSRLTALQNPLVKLTGPRTNRYQPETVAV